LQIIDLSANGEGFFQSLKRNVYEECRLAASATRKSKRSARRLNWANLHRELFSTTSGSLRGGALDRDAGPKPEQLQDGTVPSLDRQIRAWLKDPDSVIYAYWSDVTIGQSPGGNPAWIVTVTYRAKNSYGAYEGNKTYSYWLKDGIWMLKP
jgi:hypothetical protein